MVRLANAALKELTKAVKPESGFTIVTIYRLQGDVSHLFLGDPNKVRIEALLLSSLLNNHFTRRPIQRSSICGMSTIWESLGNPEKSCERSSTMPIMRY